MSGLRIVRIPVQPTTPADGTNVLPQGHHWDLQLPFRRYRVIKKSELKQRLNIYCKHVTLMHTVD